MTRVEITDELLGDLGELYFRHLCRKRSYGYLRLENVYNALPAQVLNFNFGFRRIPIAIPNSLLEEITRISKPALINGTRSFVFDFLTCKIYDSDSSEKPNARQPDDFSWVEIKSGASHLSRHQYQIAQSCDIRFAIFRVMNVMSPPRDVDIEWEFDSRRRG